MSIVLNVRVLTNRKRQLQVACFIAIVFSLALSFWGSAEAASAPTPPLMAIPGQFAVSSSGAATYSVPIKIPPGTAGLVPNLSLNYGSQGGDGPEGIGWSLSGLSSINRCPRTIAQDNVHGGVNYDNNDQFCLDGKRLLLTGTTPTLCSGGSGNVYHTEIEDFSRIISCGSSGSGPAYFKIWTKAGQILEFGNSVDSNVRVVPVGSGPIATIRSWMVNKVSDSVSNYFTVTYNCTNVSGACTDSSRTTYGEVYPLEIDYTGNSSVGTVPYNSVKFTYTSRADSIPQYQAGASQQLTVLLSHIQTYQGANLVYDYQLGYRAGSNLERSRLVSLIECDSSAKCLPPTTFGWQGGGDRFTLNSTPNYGQQSPNKIAITGDWNQDGLTDEAIVANYATCPPYPIYLGPDQHSSTYTLDPGSSFYSGATGCGFSQASSTIAPNGTQNTLLSMQAYFSGSPTKYYYFLLTSAGPLNISNYQPSALNLAPLVGDFDGNGILDFIERVGANTTNLWFGQPNGTFQHNATYTLTALSTADFDGDGCTDLYGLDNQLYAQPEIIFTCSPAVPTVNSGMPNTTGSFATIVTGDFNGDGKTDFLWSDGNTGITQLLLSTGTGFVSVNSSLPTDWWKYSIVVGDWNGDGKADLLLLADGNPWYHYTGPSQLYLSTGTGFTQALDTSNNPITMTAGNVPIVADWNNDGAADFILQGSPDTLFSLSYVPELMINVSNGIGSTTNVTYTAINDPVASIYSNGASTSYPTRVLNGAYYVVSRVDASNGLGTCTPPSTTNCYSTTYKYVGDQLDVNGRGFLGFAEMVASDPQTHIDQTTDYCTLFPLTGMVKEQKRVYSLTTTLSDLTNSYNGVSGCGATSSSGVNVVNVTQSVLVSNDLNGAAFPTKTTSYTYDLYGNALTVAVAMSDGSSSATTNTFNNDTTNWYLGQLLTVSTNSIVGSSNLTHTSSYAYDPTTGLRTQESIEPGVSSCNSGSSSCTITTSYTYDGFGNRITSTASGTGITTRTSYAIYDSLGEFKITDINALGQYEYWAYDARFGLPTSHTGPNFLTTLWSYDTFDRVTLETRPDGTETASYYNYCAGIYGGTASCPSNGTYDTWSQAFASNGVTQVGPINAIYYDMLARTLATDVQGFDGRYARVATEYDANERIQQTSRPYFTVGGTAEWTVNTYDDLGRVTRATFPDASHTDYGFNGLTTTVTNNLGQVTTTLKNAQSMIASVEDAASQTTAYVYDAFNNLTKVTDPAGNILTNSYDVRNNKVSSTDPDMGTWTYAYDVLAELTNQTDAKSQTSTITYDLLGRAVTRTEPDLYSSWTFGTSSLAHNVGQLVEAKACTTSGCTTLASDRTLTYDSLGRLSTTAIQTSTDTFGYTDVYNATNSKLAAVSYPSGLQVDYNYTSLGYLLNLTNSLGGAIWTASSRDAEMHLTQSSAGNGVITNQVFDPTTGLIQSLSAGASGAVASFSYGFDTIGNLTSRTWTDSGTPYTERFCYDSLNRVTNYAVGTSTCTDPGTVTVGYNAIGNITSKSDLGSPGTYNYPSSGSARPHAVSSISGVVDGLTNPSYTYDGNGNLTCVSSGSGCSGTVARQINVTSFNSTASIVQGSNSVSLKYDDQHQRIEQLDVAGSISTETDYLTDSGSGSLSERVTTGTTVQTLWDAANWDSASWGGTVPNNMPTWVDYITVDGQIVAQHTIQYPLANAWGFNNWGFFDWGAPVGTSLWGTALWGTAVGGGAVESWEYFTLDNLGSVAVITDPTGTVVQRQSYDAWGKARNPNGTAASCGAITSSTTRGFTNQEQMPAACLVNLNARVYDPSIGKFLAADSVIPDQYNGQSFNRYTYVDNKPLSQVDISGHAPERELSGTDANATAASPVEAPGGTGSANATTAVNQGGYLPDPAGWRSTPNTAYGSLVTGVTGGNAGSVWNPTANLGATAIASGLEKASTAVTGASAAVGQAKGCDQPSGNSGCGQGSASGTNAGLPEPGLGNGGEGTLFNIGLAIATFGASIPEQIGIKGAEETGLVTVTHFTSAEGAAAIGEGGTLNAGSFVTPSDLSGMSASQVESALEIDAGKGAFSTTFQTPASNLGPAFNGPLTSGGVPQFQLVNPTTVTTFGRTP